MQIPVAGKYSERLTAVVGLLFEVCTQGKLQDYVGG